MNEANFPSSDSDSVSSMRKSELNEAAPSFPRLTSQQEGELDDIVNRYSRYLTLTGSRSSQMPAVRAAINWIKENGKIPSKENTTSFVVEGWEALGLYKDDVYKILSKQSVEGGDTASTSVEQEIASALQSATSLDHLSNVIGQIMRKINSTFLEKDQLNDLGTACEKTLVEIRGYLDSNHAVGINLSRISNEQLRQRVAELWVKEIESRFSRKLLTEFPEPHSFEVSARDAEKTKDILQKEAVDKLITFVRRALERKVKWSNKLNEWKINPSSIGNVAPFAQLDDSVINTLQNIAQEIDVRSNRDDVLPSMPDAYGIKEAVERIVQYTNNWN